MFSLSRRQEKAYENGGVPFRALAWSLGLHALVLGGLSDFPLVEGLGVPPAEPLHAALRSLPAPAELAIEQPSRPNQMKSPRKLVTSTSIEPSVPVARAVPPAPTFSASPLVKHESVAAPPEGLLSPVRPPEAVSVALAPPAVASGPDAAGLRQYRLALAGEARRFRTYPEAARRDGITGTAEVRVMVTGGVQRQTELARSSGHAVLDTAALEMLRSAAARADLPDSLRGQNFAVLLPVVFEVDQ